LRITIRPKKPSRISGVYLIKCGGGSSPSSPSQEFSEKLQVDANIGAESGAFNDALPSVIDAWPFLSDAVRSAILALFELFHYSIRRGGRIRFESDNHPDTFTPMALVGSASSPCRMTVLLCSVGLRAI